MLDLYGDLIGLIAGGYGDGQNLNLAVDCQTIRQLVRGRVSEDAHLPPRPCYR